MVVVRYRISYNLNLIYFINNLLLINAPINVTKKVFGILNNNIPVGNTPIFQTIVHIIPNATNHAIKVVCIVLNFFEKINIIAASINPQIIHVILLINPVGKTRFKL